MFTECEHTFLLRMAILHKGRGLSLHEAQRSIERDLHGFSAHFRIAQAVHTAFAENPQPDLIH